MARWSSEITSDRKRKTITEKKYQPRIEHGSNPRKGDIPAARQRGPTTETICQYDIVYAISTGMVKASVVIDTNVLIGALRSARGQNREVLRMCLTHRCHPIIGTSLFLEYEEVMGRAAIFLKCPLGRSERTTLFRAFMKVCRWTPVYYLWRPNLPDEGDNHVFELAVAGGAGIIVTNNVKDLGAGELLFPDVRVMKPTQFVKWMN